LTAKWKGSRLNPGKRKNRKRDWSWPLTSRGDSPMGKGSRKLLLIRKVKPILWGRGSPNWIGWGCSRVVGGKIVSSNDPYAMERIGIMRVVGSRGAKGMLFVGRVAAGGNSHRRREKWNTGGYNSSSVPWGRGGRKKNVLVILTAGERRSLSQKTLAGKRSFRTCGDSKVGKDIKSLGGASCLEKWLPRGCGERENFLLDREGGRDERGGKSERNGALSQTKKGP